MLPCPSYGNNNHPSLCHWKWRQLCFLPTCLIYGRLAILDHWHHGHHQQRQHHRPTSYHQGNCDRENSRCKFNDVISFCCNLVSWNYIRTWIVMRSNCDFPLFSISKFQLRKSGHNSLLAVHAEVRNCIKVDIAWLSSYGQFVPGVIYGHDMSMQMMACRK